jgi:DNA processing protein
MNKRKKVEAFYLLMNTAPILNFEAVSELLAEIKSPDAFWELNKKETNKLNIPEKTKKIIIEKIEKTSLDDQLKILANVNCNITLHEDPEYPAILRRTKYPPPLLFYRGNINLLKSQRIFAMVGTRKASSYGEWLVCDILNDLKTHQVPVITGTAFGIDTKVIQTCIESKINCISVLASGIDCISPKKSRDLLETLEHTGGCFLTEFPPGVGSFKSNYAIRAKLIAALSTEVIIIEAPIKSGALLVAEKAHETGRNVYAPPSFYHDANFFGSHQLISEGKATLIKNFDYIAI